RARFALSPALAVELAGTIALVAAAAVACRRSPRSAAALALATAAAAELAIGAWLLPLASRHVSARAFGEEIARCREQGIPVLVVDVNEGHVGQFLFYSGGQ